MTEPAVSRPEFAFRIALDDLLGLIGQAVIRIEQRSGVEAALREMGAALLELTSMVARDPGIRMAADDLYAAAMALVAGQSASPEVVDVRRWRLLKEANARLRERLATAQPSEKARQLGLH